MSSLEEKKSELERVLGVFQNYIEGSELLDVVYSKKFGYVLLGLPAADSIDDSDVTRLEDPETLVKEIYLLRVFIQHTKLCIRFYGAGRAQRGLHGSHQSGKASYAGMDERVHGSAAGIQLPAGRTPWIMCPMKQVLPSVNLSAWIKRTSFLVEH